MSGFEIDKEMKSLCFASIFLLALTVKSGLSACPESGCKCDEFCVDSNNTMCISDNNSECSCKIGCQVYDHMLKPGENKTVYCNFCRCPEWTPNVIADCTRAGWCLPANITTRSSYFTWNKNPKCDKRPLSRKERMT